MVPFLYHITKRLLYFFTIKNGFCSQFGRLVLHACIFSACVGGSSEYKLVGKERRNASHTITLSHQAFSKLEKKWVSSAYFDRGLKYKNSRFEVVSFPSLLDIYGPADDSDAVLLNCIDDYQGIISFDDVRRYNLQLAIKIKLAQGSHRPSWLQPLLIVVPDNSNPPFLERFLTANISDLQFVRLADYYAPVDREILPEVSAVVGRDVFKDNCLFCHSINGVGGIKGGSLLEKFDFRLGVEKLRFRNTFLVVHGKDNDSKQNTKQFLTDNHLEALSKFLSKMTKSN